MPRLPYHLGLTALLLTLTCPRSASADTASGGSASTSTASPTATAVRTDLPEQPVPAGMAADATDTKKFYTITASLREEYDDNIFTAKTNKVASSVTEISPSIIFDFPTQEGGLSIRDTFDASYYSNRAGDPWDLNDEFVAQFTHSFSDRFSISAAEQFRYYTQPSLFQSVGTQYYDGAYISNLINLGFNAQWTPLISTQTTYSNTIVDYDNAQTAKQQNSVENIGSQSIGFAILPKVNLVFGGIVDDISYNQINRGYTTYTGNVGADWQVLPSLSLGGRVGGTVMDAVQTGTSTTPYASLTLNWKIGAKSLLTFNYAHEIVPSDIYVSEGQIADRLSSIFRYDITSNISVHLEGILTYGQYTGAVLTPGISNFTEEDYAIDTGASYTLNRYVSFDLGYIFSGVSSGENYRDYTRNQVYIGVRGTY